MTYYVKAMGRLLGIAADFNVIEETHVQHTSFMPAPGVGIIPGVLEIDFETGIYQVWDETDVVVSEGDLFAVIATLPRTH